MSQYASKFSSKMDEYMAFRESLGFSNHHAKVLKRFDTYCAQFHPTITELTKELVRGWFDYELRISDRNLSDRCTVIRSFARYVGGESYVLPMDCVPKRKPFTPYIMDDSELYAFFGAVDNFHSNRDPFIGMTFSVLLRLIYSCGLRPREGRILKTADIDFNTGELFIRKSKRQKDRIVVASNDMLELLKEYRIKRLLWADNEEQTFFIDGFARPLKSDEVYRHVTDCWISANPGISTDKLPKLRPYDLRHRFASELLQKWIDEGKNLYVMLPYMRTYMGHVRFEDTAYYIHLLPDRLISSPGVDWSSIDRIGPEEDIWDS